MLCFSVPFPDPAAKPHIERREQNPQRHSLLPASADGRHAPTLTVPDRPELPCSPRMQRKCAGVPPGGFSGPSQGPPRTSAAQPEAPPVAVENAARHRRRQRVPQARTLRRTDNRPVTGGRFAPQAMNGKAGLNYLPVWESEATNSARRFLDQASSVCPASTGRSSP